jgi:hypothetical protein
MYDLVISGGDSFTFGAELLTDNSVSPSPNSWANLVASRISKQHINVARSGRSNSYITRHVLYQVQTALEQNVSPEKIFVQVMWTFTNIQEFAIGKSTGEYDSPWLYLTPYSHVDETESDWFKRVDRSLPTWNGVYNSLKSFYSKNLNLGIVDFAKQYQKLVQTTPVNDSYVSVKEVLLLQTVLSMLNISYMFTYVNHYVMNGLFEDAAQNVYLKNTRSLINKNHWYTFPGNFQSYIGFDDWAKHNKYSYGTSHPLEQAHLDAAELIYHHIQQQRSTHEK